MFDRENRFFSAIGNPEPPKTTFGTSACNIAFSHMGHGSSVVYNVALFSLQPPSFLPAFLSARISAWAVALLRGSVPSRGRIRDPEGGDGEAG